MIWSDFGHEFDHVYEKLRDNFGKNGVIIYGLGERGKHLFSDLFTFSGIRTKAFVDKKAETGSFYYEGIPVYPIERLHSIRSDEPILIAANYYVAQPGLMIATLIHEGYREWEDFYVADRLWRVRDIYEKGHLSVELVEIPVTERFTLNCEKCGFFTPYYKEPKDRSLGDVIRDIDTAFSRFDNVETLRFLGGEPFLYPELCNVLKYSLGEYGDRLYNITIITNGTIPLTGEMISLMEGNEKIFLSITDYTGHVPYEKNIRKLETTLKEHNISYALYDAGEWNDLGFPAEKRPESEEQQKIRFDSCEMNCRTVYDGKLWYCSYESSGYRANLTPAYEYIDYIDLKNVMDKKIIYEYYCGFTKTGANTLCKFCKMGDGKVAGGEQMARDRTDL